MIRVAVAPGGAIRAAARHALDTAVRLRWSVREFPLGIPLVNTIDCFAIGVPGGGVRAFLMVGVRGGFTTFSSFALDTLVLARGGSHGLAVLNVCSQVASGLLAAWIGFAASWRP